MIGINFNVDNMAVLIHNQPEIIDVTFDMLVESLPAKDDTKSDMRATLYKDDSDNLYWEYTERPLTVEEQVEELKIANQISLKSKIRADELTDEELDSLVTLYDKWETGVDYKVGDIVQYDGNLYEVLQAHASKADWTPDIATSLFTVKTPLDTIPEWQQPTGSHDAYMTGDKVTYNGEVYMSTIDSNTYNPEEYPEGWELQ